MGLEVRRDKGLEVRIALEHFQESEQHALQKEDTGQVVQSDLTRRKQSLRVRVQERPRREEHNVKGEHAHRHGHQQHGSFQHEPIHGLQDVVLSLVNQHPLRSELDD